MILDPLLTFTGLHSNNRVGFFKKLYMFTLLREAKQAPSVRVGMSEGILRSLGEAGYASEGSARRSVWGGAPHQQYLEYIFDILGDIQ